MLVVTLAHASRGLADEVETETQQKLSRIEALQLAASKNLGLVVQRVETRRLALLARAAWRPFSPSLVLDLQYQKLNQFETDLFGRSEVVGYSAGVEWQSPIGTRLAARVHMNDALVGVPPSSNGGAPVGSVAPMNDVSGSLSLVQPLLKDGWLPGAALGLREAELADLMQRELFREELNSLLVDTETAYWNLAVAEADLAIKIRSRDRAKQQYDDTAENIRRGILANGEIYVVEDNVVFFDQELVRARGALVLARRRVAELLQLPADAPLSAADELKPPTAEAPPRDKAIAQGLRSSPKITAQRLRRQLLGARVSTAANQALPELDLNASVGTFGWDTGLSQSWHKAFRSPLFDGRVGLTFSLPLDRGAIGANLDAARLEADREEAELENRQNEVRYSIDNQLTDFAANLHLVTLVQRQVELAELKLGVETEKYKNGVSTLVDVVRFQRDLDNALSAFQHLIKTVYVAHARLLASEGVLHQSVGIGVN
ncbi:MAG: TolC family protein [Myxococcota bacterium]|jgi:outer membrane protein TolC|nr:TolC family protein [Myxococcota bacterium]